LAAIFPISIYLNVYLLNLPFIEPFILTAHVNEELHHLAK